MPRRAPSPAALLRLLERAYGPLVAPRRRDPVDELVLTILSQNTSDTNRDRAWDALRARFAGWDDVADAPTADVEDAIRPGGLAATKAPRIQDVLRAIRAQRGEIDLRSLRSMSDDEAAAELQRLPGVGPKTAACVLAFSLRRPVVPVDTHVHRTALRLGLLPPRTGAGPAHALLLRATKPDQRIPLHVALIHLGRDACRPASPRCAACPVGAVCPRVGVNPRGAPSRGGARGGA